MTVANECSQTEAIPMKDTSGKATRKQSRRPMRHGLRCGTLPKCEAIECELNAWRKSLEDQTVKAKGSVSASDAGTIHTAVVQLQRERLAMKHLRESWDALTIDQRTSLMETAANASEARDRAVQRLGIDAGKPVNIWAALHAPNGGQS